MKIRALGGKKYLQKTLLEIGDESQFYDIARIDNVRMQDDKSAVSARYKLDYSMTWATVHVR